MKDGWLWCEWAWLRCDWLWCDRVERAWLWWLIWLAERSPRLPPRARCSDSLHADL